MIFTGLQLEELHIEGRAVGLCRGAVSRLQSFRHVS